MYKQLFSTLKATSLPQWSNTTGIDHALFASLLPGPVTILLPRLDDDPLNPLLNPGVKEVGVRIPDSTLVCRLSAALASAAHSAPINGDDVHERNCNLSSSAIPLVLTSANRSGRLSTLSPEESCQIFLWFKQ